MSLNIAKSNKKRVVIVGGGFGGLKLANKLKKSGFQVVLIDKNNYHQFPPLIYQVASAGMEPTSISFPFRKIFQHRKDFFFRMAEVRAIFPEKNMIQTSIGKAEYDYLVLAAGTTTNFFGNKHIEEEAMPMKNVSEAMGLRNALLANLERALTCSTKQEQQELLNIEENNSDGDVPEGKFIKRIKYPQSESFNPNRPMGDNQGTKIWWDVADTNNDNGQRVQPNNFR